MSQAPLRLSYSAKNCSVTRTLDIVGEKWTLLVLREAFFGLRRFEEFQTALGCARNLLSARLATLTEHGVLRRELYREDGQRARPEYVLTEKGRDLVTVVVALLNWGDRWARCPGGEPVLLCHRGCRAPVRALLTCEAGHAGLALEDLTLAPGPGAIKIGAAAD